MFYVYYFMKIIIKVCQNSAQFLEKFDTYYISIYFSIIFCTQPTKATWHDGFIKDEDSNKSREYDIFLIVKYETLLDHFIDTCRWLYLVKEFVLYDKLIFNLL